jgi:hypothetical protein
MADSDRSSADRFDCPSCGAPLQAGLADQFFCECGGNGWDFAGALTNLRLSCR